MDSALLTDEQADVAFFEQARGQMFDVLLRSLEDWVAQIFCGSWRFHLLDVLSVLMCEQLQL